MKCPTSHASVANPSNIAETPCPKCGAMLEFFGDDRFVKCHVCSERVANPSLKGEEG